MCGDRSDDDILKSVAPVEADIDDPLSEVEVETVEINRPPPPDIFTCVNGIRDWMLTACVDESVHGLLSSIENAIFEENMRKRHQSKITDYFTAS